MLLARMWEVALPHLYDWALNLNNVCLQTQDLHPTVTVRQSPGWRGEAERADPWPRNRNAEARRGEADGRSGTEERERRRGGVIRKESKAGGRSRGPAKGEVGTGQSRSGGGRRAGASRGRTDRSRGQKGERLAAQEREAQARVAENGAAVPGGRSPGGRSPGLPGAPRAGVPDAVLPLPFDPRPQRVLRPRRGRADPARPDPSGLDHPVGSDADVHGRRRLPPRGAASGPPCARDPAPGESRPGCQGPHASRPGGSGRRPRVRDRLWSHS